MKLFIHALFSFLLVSQICFAQWTQVGLSDEVIKDIAVQNQNIFAVTNDTCYWHPALFDPCLGKLYRSTDNGLNWTTLADSNVLDVAISTSGKIFKIEKDSVYGFGKSETTMSEFDNYHRKIKCMKCRLECDLGEEIENIENKKEFTIFRAEHTDKRDAWHKDPLRIPNKQILMQAVAEAI